jgi:hypothetical protein
MVTGSSCACPSLPRFASLAGFPELGSHATTAMAHIAFSWLSRERPADNVKFNYLNRNLMVSTFDSRSLYFDFSLRKAEPLRSFAGLRAASR